MLSSELDVFLEKTKKLENLLEYFSSLKMDDKLKPVCTDFYLKNIISNNYTHFETYLRGCLQFIVEQLNSLGEVNGDVLSKDLHLDIIKKCMEQLPKEIKDDKILRPDKVSFITRIQRMTVDNIYKIELNEHSFVQLPHSAATLEKILCKYFNRQSILQSIFLPKEYPTIQGMELVEEETAFTFLNQYVERLRHPIVHQGICVYLSSDTTLEVNDDYVRMILQKFTFMARELNKVFIAYSKVLSETTFTLEGNKKELATVRTIVTEEKG